MSDFPIISSISDARGRIADFTASTRTAGVSVSEPIRPGQSLEFSAAGEDGDSTGVDLTVRIGGREIATQQPGPVRFEVTSDDIGHNIAVVVKARGAGTWHAFDSGARDEHDANVTITYSILPPLD